MPEAPEVDASYAVCRRIARHARSNFHLAFYLLPRPKRDALFALYAFMRLVDDVSDTPGDLAAKQKGIAAWRAQLDAAFAGDTGLHPVLPAFADTVRRFGIPARYFNDLISGAEMDLSISSYATFDHLREYCYRVAGTVGLTCLHVFGFHDPRALELAEKLGLAFQLTNILRDVRRDYEIGRVYLPQDTLHLYGCRPSDLGQGNLRPALREVLASAAERAQQFYAEGARLVPLVDEDSRAALWGLVRIYSSLLAKIRSRGFDVFSSRVCLTSKEKFAILLRARLGRWDESDALA